MTDYSIGLCRALSSRLDGAELHVAARPERYERGDALELFIRGVWPDRRGNAVFRIEKFVGGGFAGQVYRCRLESLDSKGIDGLEVGGVYGIKILIPPSRPARRIRDAVYWLAFQGPFTAQAVESACRSGLLWQKAIRRGAGAVFGSEDAVADVFAWFFDPGQRAYGEIREWVEGRMWRLEPDTHLARRRQWRDLSLVDTDAPEYIAKRQFMARFVDLLHDMGAPELARQYEWWTMKSQSNLMKRFGCDSDPGAGLCAFDFRAGMALLPWLPMSPGDVRLIWRGLRRGALVQFDRGDLEQLRTFVAAHAADFEDLTGMLEELARCERAYRRAMPDITRQGVRLLRDRELRADVRKGLVTGWWCRDQVDEDFGRRLEAGGVRFAGFWLLGLIPLLGRPLRRWWGNEAYRRHWKAILQDGAYRGQAIRAAVTRRLVAWHRAGRAGEGTVLFLQTHPGCFWLRRCTLGLLPAGLHRVLSEPGWAWERVRVAWRFMRDFFRDAGFRERWLSDQVEDGYKQGMLSEAEREQILEHVRDPFIVKYLRSLGVHFATLPITQIVSVICAVAVFVWKVMQGAGWKMAGLYFGGVLLFFQAIPVSPGSLCRGAYVVCLMIRERNYRDYLVAAPVSFVKYLGYLAFPFQMITTYPALARFMGSRWAMDAVRIVPVFGERGALLEHMVFDLFFNVPRVIGGWLGRHARLALNVWMALGTLMFALLMRGCSMGVKGTTSCFIAVVVLCILPRVLFYPVLSRGSEARARRGSP